MLCCPLSCRGGWFVAQASCTHSLSHPSVLQVEVQLSLPVAQPGKYVLLVEYANTNALQTVGIAVNSPHSATQQGTFTFYPCVYRYGQLKGERVQFSAMARTALPPVERFLVYHRNRASFSVVHLSSVCPNSF